MGGFADGLAVGGDVVANWTVLDPITTVSSNGSTLTEQPDGSILASGLRPSTDVYTNTTTTNLTGITGFRLEVIADPSLPNNGPGRFDNGNIVLSEFGVDIQTIPEPAVCTMVLVLVAGGLLTRCRRTACG